MGTALAVVTAIGTTLGASAATAAAVGTVASVAVIGGIAAQQYSSYKERQAMEAASAARLEAAEIAANTRQVVDKTRPDLDERNLDPLTGEEKSARKKKASAKSRFKVAKDTVAQVGVQTGAATQAVAAESVAGVQI